MISKQITITGRVQNVGFRFHAHDMALKLGLTGFVKNQANGNVYCEVEGDENAVAEFIDWCRRGPVWARVSSVDWVEQPLQHFATFQIQR